MKCLVVYFNNVTKDIHNEFVYGDSMESVIYNFTHTFNRYTEDKIVNIIELD